MTIDTEPSADVTGADIEPAGYVPESAPARAWSWLKYAPLERVPWATAPIVWTAAEILRATSVPWTVPGLGTVLAASWVYARASRKAARSEHLELDGPEVAAIVGVPGLWLTAATRIGPLPFIGSPAHDLISGAFAALYGLGPVWLRRHAAVQDAAVRRAMEEAEVARLAEERRQLALRRRQWHIVAPIVGLGGSHLVDYEVSETGSERWEINTKGARVLARNVPFKNVEALLAGEGMEILGGRPVPVDRVYAEPDPERFPHKLFITFRQADLWQGGGLGGVLTHPLASGELDTSLPGAEYFTNPAPSIKDPICLGLNPDTRQPIMLTLLGKGGGCAPHVGDGDAHRVLVLGTSGSGKSMVLDTIRERVTACPDAVLLLINLSKGTEDKWWRMLTATDALTDDPDNERVRARALAILDFISDVVNGGRPRPPGHRTHTPAPGEPALVVMIDEVDTTTQEPDRKEQLGIIASKCRSEGIILILGSQRPFDKDLGGKTRAMLTDIVWGKLKARDLSQASGGLATLPDLNEFGQGHAGFFGIAPYPLFDGAPVLLGRTFFWGEHSDGLIEIISAREAALGGERPMQVLEPGLAERFGDQWAEILGTATEDQHLAVTTKLAARGHAASTAAKGELRQNRLDAIGQEHYGDSAPRRAPAPPPAAPPAAQAPIVAPDLPRMPPGGPADDPRDVLPAADRAKLWQLLNGTPGGISTRRAENGGLLRRVDPLPGNETWSREWVGKQLQVWADAGYVRVTGKGPDQRWIPVLRVVPDVDDQAAPTAPEPQTAVSAPREPDRISPPGEFTEHEMVMIAAGWIVQDPGEGLETARQQMPGHVVSQALELIRHDPGYVRAELDRIVSGARRPAPASRPLPNDDWDGDDEDLDDEDDDDEDEDEAAP